VKGGKRVPLVVYRTAEQADPRLGLVNGDDLIDVAAAGGPASLTAALQLPASELFSALNAAAGATAVPVSSVELLAPIDHQEVWAAGVTYLRSRDARMEESESAKSAYDLVYEADRPEIFFKATPNRVSGPGQAVAIRGDSTWDVPEPELALVINTSGEIIGYTIGNDVSSRSIEGANPLYLPQAKLYSKCAGLGPAITLTTEVRNIKDRAIRLVIRRGGDVAFDGSTSTSQIHRTFEDLVHYLRLDNEFPHGVILMTGTGIVPGSDFTLEGGDEVEISIDGVGTLTNPVIRLS
jgi:2-dehydro-3-deoxy-D-arabinonate dehydratase